VSHCTYQNMIRSVRIFANCKTSYTTETILTHAIHNPKVETCESEISVQIEGYDSNSNSNRISNRG